MNRRTGHSAVLLPPSEEKLVVTESSQLQPALLQDLHSVLNRYALTTDPANLVDSVSHVLAQVLPPSASTRASYGRALARGLAVRREMEEAEGGSVSADTAARMLGMSKTSILRRFEKGQLLGWRDIRQNAVRFPVWQFSDHGVLVGLEHILGILRKTPLSDWGRVSFFLEKRQSLNGLRPLDWLRQGRIDEVERVAWADLG